MYLGNLANALMERISVSGGSPTPSDDVDRAIAAAGEVYGDLPACGPDWARAAANLATAMSLRWSARRHDADADAACAHWREIIEAATAATGVRVAAAQDLSFLAARTGSAEVAANAAADAVRLLPLMAWVGLRWRSRARQLNETPAIATDAAALAIACGRPIPAVELLEQGRAVLWGQQLDLRGDLDRLERCAPDLAAALTRVRRHLDRW